MVIIHVPHYVRQTVTHKYVLKSTACLNRLFRQLVCIIDKATYENI